MTLRARLAAWLLREPTLESQLLAALREDHAEQARLTEHTLDVMRALVESVGKTQETLSNYLNLFTHAEPPQLRTMDEASEVIFERELQEKRKAVTHRPVATPPFDPFTDFATIKDAIL